MHRKIAAALVLCCLVAALPAEAQPSPSDLLVPVGGGYADVYGGIVAPMIEREQGDEIRITVLPSTYSTNAEKISVGEREQNLIDAERRRFELAEACRRAAPEGVTCTARIAPIFVRADAEDAVNLEFFGADVDAVFVLGGDQGVAMQVLANTPVEDALAELYAQGVIVGGTSAGGALLSRKMIADYSPNFAAANALDEGAALVWNDQEQRGLDFGLQDAVLDQHFFQRGRMGRLLEAIVRPDVPHVGVGIDAYTGLRIENGTVVTGVFGLYTAAVLDAKTLGAAESAKYVGNQRTLSLRNVLVHLLAPGDNGYDLAARRHSLAEAPLPSDDAVTDRSFESLALPQGAGSLLLSGGSTKPGEDAVYVRFLAEVDLSVGPLLVVATGYPNDKPAQRTADKLAQTIGKMLGEETAPGGPGAAAVESKMVSSKGKAELQLDKRYAGIVVIGRDQSLIDPLRLGAVRDAWLGGTPLLLDGAPVALAGAVFSRHGPPAKEGEPAEKDAQRSFLLGRTVITDGLDLLPVTVEPQVLESNRWGRLFSLAYNNPDQPALGVAANTALVVGAQGAGVVGEGTVLVLDLRQAVRALGLNEGYVIANGLLDVFAPGDELR
jgi:cyanophycinase